MKTLQNKLIEYINSKEDKRLRFLVLDSSMRIAGVIPLNNLNNNYLVEKKYVYLNLDNIRSFTTPFIYLASIEEEIDTCVKVKILKIFNIEQFICVHGKNILIENLNFTNFNLKNSDFSGSTLVNTNLSHCYLDDSIFENSYIKDCDFKGSSLIRSNFNSSNVINSDFSRCDMSHSDLRNSKFIKTNLRNTELWSSLAWNTDFKESFVSGLDIERSDMRGKYFK